MAAFKTVVRNEKELQGYVESKDHASLAKAMEFLLRQHNLVGRRTTVASWMELPIEVVREVAESYQDCPTQGKKNVLAAFLAQKVVSIFWQHQRELQTQLETLQDGVIPEGVVDYMVNALDTFIR